MDNQQEQQTTNEKLTPDSRTAPLPSVRLFPSREANNREENPNQIGICFPSSPPPLPSPPLFLPHSPSFSLILPHSRQPAMPISQAVSQKSRRSEATKINSRFVILKKKKV